MKKVIILLLIIAGVAYWRLQEPLEQLKTSDDNTMFGMSENMRKSIKEWDEAQQEPDPATEQEIQELENLIAEIQEARTRAKVEGQEKMPHQKIQRALKLCAKVYKDDRQSADKCYDNTLSH